MNAEDKLARQRLSVLELAERLGNVREACRQRGVSRTQFYEYKRRFQTHGIEGLKDLPPIHKTHPQTTPPEVVARIVELSLANPTRGCNWLHDRLQLEGVSVSAPTIQAILNKHELGSRYARLLKLESQAYQHEIELTPEQVAWIEKANPCFRERHVESSRPGELLCADTFFVGTLKGVGKVYLHAVVDTYGSYAFGYLHTSRQPEAAALVLHNDVLPFYQQHGLTVGAVLTDNGREFCGTETHPYEFYLALNDIEHRRTQVRSRRPTASWSVSTARPSMSSFGSPFAPPCMSRWRRSRPTLTAGWWSTTPSARIKAIGTWANARSRRSCHTWKAFAKKVKNTTETYAVKHEHIPDGELEIKRGMAVFARDGQVGHIDDVVVDPVNGNITGIIMREGHLWGAREVVVGIGHVKSIEYDGVYLKSTKTQVSAYPMVHAH